MLWSRGKCSKMQRIVSIREMVMRWRRKAWEVPGGHVAVCVGASRKRFIVRATYLNHPIFKTLLVKAEEEYGFCNHGPLVIPCDESLFQQLLPLLDRPLPLFDFETHSHCLSPLNTTIPFAFSPPNFLIHR
ncbi:hypothetical protein VNO78_05258 [Psophocarpus tetragonolobus]|uniref:Uncharacterized protein n=1 Tax=Psophocarpus tetragonolobus TaxID=3891 RepID=A0AAN9XRB5_PSOTE